MLTCENSRKDITSLLEFQTRGNSVGFSGSSQKLHCPYYHGEMAEWSKAHAC
jgi:hypothetical protein